MDEIKSFIRSQLLSLQDDIEYTDVDKLPTVCELNRKFNGVRGLLTDYILCVTKDNPECLVNELKFKCDCIRRYGL